MLRTTYKPILISMLIIGLAVLLASCASQEEVAPTAEQVSEPTMTPEPAQEPTATSEPIILADPVIEFSADSQNILAGECTTLRWRTENVETLYVHPIFDSYDKYEVGTEGTLEVCPTETLPYLLKADLADGSTKGRSITISVTAPEDE